MSIKKIILLIIILFSVFIISLIYYYQKSFSFGNTYKLPESNIKFDSKDLTFIEEEWDGGNFHQIYKFKTKNDATILIILQKNSINNYFTNNYLSGGKKSNIKDIKINNKQYTELEFENTMLDYFKLPIEQRKKTGQLSRYIIDNPTPKKNYVLARQLNDEFFIMLACLDENEEKTILKNIASSLEGSIWIELIWDKILPDLSAG